MPPTNRQMSIKEVGSSSQATTWPQRTSWTPLMRELKVTFLTLLF